MPYKDKKDREAFIARRRIAGKKVIEEWFRLRCCVDCGNSDRRVLQADHVRGKNFNISGGSLQSIARLKAELSLCECRCANCHVIRHWEERKRAMALPQKGLLTNT